MNLNLSIGSMVTAIDSWFFSKDLGLVNFQFDPDTIFISTKQTVKASATVKQKPSGNLAIPLYYDAYASLQIECYLTEARSGDTERVTCAFASSTLNQIDLQIPSISKSRFTKQGLYSLRVDYPD